MKGLHQRVGSRVLLQDVSFNLQQGEVVALLGPNGAGKTTSFYAVIGLVPLTAGTVMVDGVDVSAWPVYRRARAGVAYLLQEPSIFRTLTVEENILGVVELVEKNPAARRAQVETLLAEFGLLALRQSPAVALSGGERRRLEIARALAARPKYILLDEPFAGVDPISIADIRQLVLALKARGLGVLITDHNVRETLKIVDRAYILHQGRVLMDGTPEAILTNAQVRQVYLGNEF